MAGEREAQRGGCSQIACGSDLRARRGQVKLAHIQFVTGPAIDALHPAAHRDRVRHRLLRRRNPKIQASLRVTNRAHPEHLHIAAGAAGEIKTIEWKFLGTE